jgi:hypothetical protein
MHRLFLVLISVFASSAFSAELTNLYQSQVTVVDQSEQQRLKVAPDALQNVILKVVGNRSVLSNTDISSILQQSEQLIQQYQYKRTNIVADDLTQPDKLAVVLSFNPVQLNRLLSQLGLPIWSKSRPDILLWLITDNMSQPILSADDVFNPIVIAVEQSSDSRGLEMILPAMDLQDQSSLENTYLQQSPLTAVKQASMRYAPQVIVTASISENTIRWHAQLGSETQQWLSGGATTTAISEGINQLTDLLASQYSQTITQTNSDQTYSLTIKNVTKFSDYSDVIHYLSNLQYVSGLVVDSLDDNQLNVSVSIKGNIAVFERTLAISNVIAKESVQSNGEKISYTLIP